MIFSYEYDFNFPITPFQQFFLAHPGLWGAKCIFLGDMFK